MSEVRERLVVRFRDIAAERLERINAIFVGLQAAPTDTEQATVLKREVHTLKGEARMTGFRALSDVAHRIEELLEGIGTGPLLSQRVDALFAGFDVIEKLVAEPPDAPADHPLIATWEVAAQAALGTNLPPAAPMPQEPGPRRASVGGDGGAVASAPAKPSPPAVPAAAPAVSRQGGEVFLRVSLGKLDQVTRVSGDLALDHLRGERALDAMVQRISRLSRVTREAQGSVLQAGRIEDASHAALVETLVGLRGQVERQRELLEGLQLLAQRADDQDFDLGLKLLELDERVRELRFLPLSSLFGRFPRAVHDLARDQGKTVQLEVRGDAVELDKQVLDRIAEPLLHLVRNAVDHGVETPEERVAAGKPKQATVRLIARTLGSAVEIEIEDDGRGVDAAQVRERAVRAGTLTKQHAQRIPDHQILDRIFDVGLSTRDEVTAISGRGVGLAVVKDTVEQLGGTATVYSTPGEGTRFRLRVPTSVVLARVLLVRASGRTYALPVDLVRATRHVTEDQWERSGDVRVLRIDDQVLPVVDLHAVLGVPAPHESARTPVAMVEHRGRQIALRVGSFAGQHQAVQRPLDPFVSGIGLFHGTVGTPDGDLALLLSVPDVVRRGASAGVAHPSLPPAESAVPRKRVLVVDDSEFTRDLVVQVLRDMDLDVVEAVDGRQGLDRFRDSPPALVLTDLDMPVMDGFELLREIRSRREGASLPVVVFSTRGSPEDKERAAALGADAYVVKTEFREAALRDLVRRYLDDEDGR